MKLAQLYQIAAGLCDTATGLLLIMAPVWTLHLMGVSVTPQPRVFSGYIGAFVLGVGLSYLWTLRSPLPTHVAAWKTHWQLTAIIRYIVAGFVTQAVLRGELDLPWLLVAATDATFAVLQTIGLIGRWLERTSAVDELGR